MLSWVAIIANFHCCVKFLIDGYSSFLDEFQIMDLGILPVFRENGENPMLLALAEFKANSIDGNLDTQSICLEFTHCRSIWVIVWLACSVDPSVVRLELCFE